MPRRPSVSYCTAKGISCPAIQKVYLSSIHPSMQIPPLPNLILANGSLMRDQGLSLSVKKIHYLRLQNQNHQPQNQYPPPPKQPQNCISPSHHSVHNLATPHHLNSTPPTIYPPLNSKNTLTPNLPIINSPTYPPAFPNTQIAKKKHLPTTKSINNKNLPLHPIRLLQRPPHSPKQHRPHTRRHRIPNLLLDILLPKPMSSRKALQRS